uniref:Uncharacterized protein n=1 Tax=Sphaerodactylus townsendi TaxID=933632 RepID=A0ACB8G6R3_9SAUR
MTLNPHLLSTDSSSEAQPKYIKGGKRYGRRSLPEFQEPGEDFAKVTVIEPLDEEGQQPCLSSDACDEGEEGHGTFAPRFSSRGGPVVQ